MESLGMEMMPLSVTWSTAQVLLSSSCGCFTQGLVLPGAGRLCLLHSQRSLQFVSSTVCFGISEPREEPFLQEVAFEPPVDPLSWFPHPFVDVPFLETLKIRLDRSPGLVEDVPACGRGLD